MALILSILICCNVKIDWLKYRNFWTGNQYPSFCDEAIYFLYITIGTWRKKFEISCLSCLRKNAILVNLLNLLSRVARADSSVYLHDLVNLNIELCSLFLSPSPKGLCACSSFQLKKCHNVLKFALLKLHTNFFSKLLLTLLSLFPLLFTVVKNTIGERSQKVCW